MKKYEELNFTDDFMFCKVMTNNLELCHEMQVSQKSNFPKRIRYYQGMIDLNLIERGADYNDLRKSYIIFICPFDVFEKGLHKYTFENQCMEMSELVKALDNAVQKARNHEEWRQYGKIFKS